MERASVNPWPWSDQAQLVEGHRRELICSVARLAGPQLLVGLEATAMD